MMLGASTFLHAAFRRCAAISLVAVVLAGAAYLGWTQTRRQAVLEHEVQWLRARLGEKRDQVARQRAEMAAVASAAERVARTASALQERATQARRLADMEESRNP